jgi:anaerobic magnesium-protoporphyrin IX monomethyl ester cyclase
MQGIFLNILLIDLNNFSRYPTMSIGYMTAILREAGHTVRVLSPFSVGVSGFPRVLRPKPWAILEQWIRYWTATTSTPFVKQIRQVVKNYSYPASQTNQKPTISAARALIDDETDLILISAYSMYYEVCAQICKIAGNDNVPVVIGGPYFNYFEISNKWLEISGISAIFSGEPENYLVKIVEALGCGTKPDQVPGLSLPGCASSAQAPPLENLDSLPFPDYSDFPWDLYPNRIVPMMTGRGCGWGVCTFCSDVVTSAGRGFRTRSPGNVIDEMRYQSDRYKTNTFTFLDLKLNSDLSVWHELAYSSQSAVPNCIWTASLHANANASNHDGLSASELKNARAGGLVRLTTGLESGSARVLNSMGKGTNPEVLSQFIRYAAEAGISVRLTAIVGYPGETGDDVKATADFLDGHYDYVDRVVLNRLAIQPGTPLHHRVVSKPDKFPQITDLKFDKDTAMFDHFNATFTEKNHRRAMLKLMYSVHKINRKPRLGSSAFFEGVM